MRKFLRSEQLVLLGMLGDALRTDLEIADQFDLKKGTVAAARRRLVDSGAVRFANVPSFNRLGCEMLGFHAGTADLSLSPDKRASQYAEFCKSAPQIFFGMLEGHTAVLCTALRTATEMESFVQAYSRAFANASKGSRPRLQSRVFPYALTMGSYKFNFGPLVHRCFGLDVPYPAVRLPRQEGITHPGFSRTEKDAFMAFIEDPGATDERIASAVKVSRQSVTKMRHRFVEDGLMTPIWVPRFHRWGFEILVAVYARFSSELPWERINEDVEPREALHLSFFTLAKGDEAVGMYVHPTFQAYAELSEKVLTLFERLEVFDSKPEVNLFALDRAVELRWFDFAPAVRHLLTTNPPV